MDISIRQKGYADMVQREGRYYIDSGIFNVHFHYMYAILHNSYFQRSNR